ncbi:MAG: hypothetical protein EXR77_14185 [Myxococcales bacterium]|nr:hypothetical protein [Myxococcales bacterium]
MTQQSTSTKAANDLHWLSVAEKGSVISIALVVWLATMCGRPPARWLMKAVALWYTLLHRRVRQASREFGERLHGRPRTLREVYRHVLCFAEATLDRLWLVQGRGDLFTVTRTGHDYLVQLAAAQSGAILLSAHLGSTAAMSIGNYDEKLKIRVVGYFRNAKIINAALARLNPRAAAQVVHIEPGQASAVLAMRDRIERGEILAIAADRAGLNERVVHADFLGKPAPFPSGPFLLAAMLGCPVYFVCGVFRAPNHYDLYCEPFAEQVILPRKDRQRALQNYVDRYAARTEHFARLAPDNWFNFYGFWQP